MSDTGITVTLDRRFAPAFTAVGAVVGLGAAFAVGPVVGWLLETVDGAPAPLRLLDQLPLGWAIAVLTVAGALVGWYVFHRWSTDVGEVRVEAERIVLVGAKASSSYTREEVAEIFLDGDELVLLDARSRELSRTTSDGAVAHRLAAAFEQLGYPWRGTGDPHDAHFTAWVDRSTDLDPRAHELLRRRRRALDDGRTGTAEEAREELLDLGIVVRDRSGRQQYRRAAP